MGGGQARRAARAAECERKLLAPQLSCPNPIPFVPERGFHLPNVSLHEFKGRAGSQSLEHTAVRVVLPGQLRRLVAPDAVSHSHKLAVLLQPTHLLNYWHTMGGRRGGVACVHALC